MVFQAALPDSLWNQITAMTIQVHAGFEMHASVAFVFKNMLWKRRHLRLDINVNGHVDIFFFLCTIYFTTALSTNHAKVQEARHRLEA